MTNTLGAAATQISNRLVVSPDGTKAAFDGQISSGRSRIFVIDLTSKSVQQLTNYPSEPDARDGFPSWVGADRVAFQSDYGGGDQVYALSSSAQGTSGGIELPGAVELAEPVDTIFTDLEAGNPAVIVASAGQPVGVLTRSDLLEYLAHNGAG